MADAAVDQSMEKGTKPTLGPLRRAEAQFRAFVEANTDVVYRVSPDWSELRSVDGRGFIADTAEPRRNWMDDYILAEDKPNVVAAIEAAIKDRAIFQLEPRIRRAGS